MRNIIFLIFSIFFLQSHAETLTPSTKARVHIVKYADFECPYGKSVQPYVKKALEKYGDQVSFNFKTMPLDYHPTSRIAAKYYYALKQQSPALALKFYNFTYENQAALKSFSGNEDFLRKTVKQLGADMKKIEIALSSPSIEKQISADVQEAITLGINETPGILVNGLVVPGGIEPTWEQIDATVQKALQISKQKKVAAR